IPLWVCVIIRSDMPRSKLAVAVYHGIAAVSLLFSSTIILRSGSHLISSAQHDNATRGVETVHDSAPRSAAKPADPGDPKAREAIADKFIHQKLGAWKDRMN